MFAFWKYYVRGGNRWLRTAISAHRLPGRPANCFYFIHKNQKYLGKRKPFCTCSWASGAAPAVGGRSVNPFLSLCPTSLSRSGKGLRSHPRKLFGNIWSKGNLIAVSEEPWWRVGGFGSDTCNPSLPGSYPAETGPLCQSRYVCTLRLLDFIWNSKLCV